MYPDAVGRAQLGGVLLLLTDIHAGAVAGHNACVGRHIETAFRLIEADGSLRRSDPPFATVIAAVGR